MYSDVISPVNESGDTQTWIASPTGRCSYVRVIKICSHILKRLKETHFIKKQNYVNKISTHGFKE